MQGLASIHTNSSAPGVDKPGSYMSRHMSLAGGFCMIQDDNDSFVVITFSFVFQLNCKMLVLSRGIS